MPDTNEITAEGAVRLTLEFPVPPDGRASWVNELFTPLVFPWCDSWAEVENKAIRILAGSDASAPIYIYIFQNYRSSMIQYVLPSQLGQGDFPGAGQSQIVCDYPASYLELTITGYLDQPFSPYAFGLPDSKLGPISGF